MVTKETQNRILLILDLLVLGASFFISVFLRFHEKPGISEIARSYDGLYFLILEIILSPYVVVFFINEYGRKPLSEQDPFEKIVGVIKNQIIVFICLVVLLYLIRSGYWASRAVVIMTVCFSTVFGIIVRFLFGSYLKKRERKHLKRRKFLLITGDSAADRDAAMLKKVLGEGNEISCVVSRKEYAERNGSADFVNDFDEILVFLKEDGQDTLYRRSFQDTEKPVSFILNTGDAVSSMDMVELLGEIPVIRYSGLKEKCPVLGVGFSVTNLSEAVQYVRDNLERLKGKYICFGNVHTSVMARENDQYRTVQNSAAFVMPDGVPIHREQRKKGFLNACRVAGPDFMRLMFLSAMDGKTSMYFYGSTPETIDGLRKNLENNYPGIDLKGFESPPFRELTEEEDRETVDRINASGADILWVGLGAPRQENWMYEHRDKINALMLGVGAGFDFHAGAVKRAPVWIQKLGMEWLYRLTQSPKKLLGRYLITNTKFVIYKLFDLEPF